MSAQPETLWQLSPMTEWHLPLVQEIEEDVYPFPWTTGIFRDCLQAGYSAWVVTRADEVIAYALMSLGAYEAHILNLCVATEYQRQGLGRFLLQHLKRLALAAGVHLLLLEVRKSNTAAIALYRRAGFHRLGVRKGYYPDHGGREDAWLLGYRLKPETPAA